MLLWAKYENKREEYETASWFSNISNSIDVLSVSNGLVTCNKIMHKNTKRNNVSDLY